VGLTGYWLNTRIYCGKYLYIDHFIIKPGNRSRGVGAQLLSYVRALADHYQCEQVCLDTFVSNSMAQSFWTRHGFSIVGFHYVAK
jgi:ribosomal protein S18 acetylase RimI-like enzyme